MRFNRRLRASVRGLPFNLCFQQKSLAGVRQLDPTWHPPEKGRTQFFFQRSYLLAKRRLANANLFGGASKIHFFGDWALLPVWSHQPRTKKLRQNTSDQG